MDIKGNRLLFCGVTIFVWFSLTLPLARLSSAEPPVPPFPRPAVAPIPVKVIVVANFEPGKDTGDAPGEFQFWAEREHLDEVIPLKGPLHPLRRNKDGLYGMVWGKRARC